ncbi:type IV pilus modification protein PilV [Acinetobacter radioresistens]|nr:type IV pilus modification protein PilV [Acinetobacter radioresistens]NTY96216.1 type IV pilus modification protein PilV [Acinetobacter radioresistens]PKD82832.1 type IV pilus modification protein PilV [Acinetobacter radioresistens]RSO70840.1 type IV pilus modification protein PilV [Acinetobacter radioresistens]
MFMNNYQKGIGLVEIMVALLILAIGILGFIALQYRALEATSEGSYRIQAINLARDLAERIRINRDAFSTYQQQVQLPLNQKAFKTNCFSNNCSAVDLADFDVAQVANRAASFGMTINIMNCQGNNNNRNCIYVAWGDSSATDGTGTGDCTNGTAYNPASTCIIMEAY